MSDKAKKIAKVMSLVVISWLLIFVVLYILIEIFFIDAIIKKLPASYQVALGTEGYVLMQYSKKGIIPRDYIAILGDSYAYGTGEWMMHVINQKQADYSAAHVIHKKLDTDVITFGTPGVGSLASMLSLPAYFLASTRSFYRYDIEDPKTLVVFFYEGNDLIDNLRDIENTYVAREYDPNLLSNTDYFEHFMDVEFGKDAAFGDVKKLSLMDNLLLYRLIVTGFQDIYSQLVKNAAVKSNDNTDWEISDDNLADINGEPVKMGANLQSPALELNETETNLALYVFGQSLHKMHKLFPRSKVLVVYIPSNLSSYKWFSETVDAYVLLASGTGSPKTWQHAFYKAADVDKRSNYLCSQVENIVKAQNHSFLDVRRRIREETRSHIVHHAWDWMHFDRKGYQALGDEISSYLALQPKFELPDKAISSGCAALHQ
jgi:hypothetical protein